MVKLCSDCGMNAARLSKTSQLHATKSSLKTIIVHGVTACPNQNRISTKLTGLSFYNKRGKSYLNLTADFKESLKAPLSIKVEGEVCEVHRDQCKSIPGINYDHFCSVFGETYYGATYFAKLKPPIMGCPIKKGTYVMENAEINHEEILKTIPFPIGRYKFKNVVYDMKSGKRRPVICWICEFRVQTTSKRTMQTIKTTVLHKVTICLIIVVNINCAVSQYNVPYYYERSPVSTSLGDAIQFLRDFDREAAELCNRVANTEWRFSTNSTDYNKRKMREQQNLASKFECLSWRRASMFDTTRILDSNTRRQLGRIVTQGKCGLGEERYREITQLITSMKDNYNNVKICPYRGQSPNLYGDPYEAVRQQSRESYVTAYTGFCDLRLDPDLNRIMENSRSESELRYVWTAFRDKTGPPIKNTFMRYLDLANQAAEKHGFRDAGEQMRNMYEDPDFFFTVQELWTKVQPLYKKLFTFVRKGLVRQYGEGILRRDGPIPAHILGNMWAQDWRSLFPIVQGIKETPDVTKEMVRQNYTPLKIFQLAEEFFTSMGLPPMPPEFWRNSLLQKPNDAFVQCTASAWDFCNNVDFRIKQCTQVTLQDFINSHHEMTHIHYYMQYSTANKPFVYREGPNPAFHEGIANAIGLCVGGPVHLQRLGILKSPIIATTGTTMLNIEYLLTVALDKLPFMAFSIALEKWRWYVFEKGPEQMNERYWELKLRYQGVIPPSSRNNAHFDPGSKFHVISDQDYIKYFVATILQFQVFNELCMVANQKTTSLHTCDFSGSREAGRLLADIMQQGASMSASQLIKLMTKGKTARLSAEPLLEFFRPLEAWLDTQIQNEPVIGWNSNMEDVSLFQQFLGRSGSSKSSAAFVVLLTSQFYLLLTFNFLF
ncbi:angiotensin-converting enzyme [Culicoides brevitarsis]|uniref:angiotensin-converting enzyme n=1 Tax=Culicoides brevitarsis TaxID=469753 RepID=UPI00307C63E5